MISKSHDIVKPIYRDTNRAMSNAMLIYPFNSHMLTNEKVHGKGIYNK
jgi:hypothetical protein